LEKNGIPTSTIVSAAFLTTGRLAAKNLQIDGLPLVVTPHPLNDLTPDQVRNLARAAYPLIIRQLTSQDPLEESIFVDYVHPAARKKRVKEKADQQRGEK
jgi:hypothetical protein